MSKTAQVGGDHYKSAAGQQHWDLVEDFDIAYLEANATKYLMRYDRKGSPLLDLGKAKSYLERLLESRTVARRRVTIHRLETFCHVNDLSPVKSELMALILNRGTRRDFEQAIAIIDRLMKEFGA